jgi:superfamily II DNA or RNA helicase
MVDYTLNKDISLTSTQNEIVDFMLHRSACINAAQTGLGKTYTNCTAMVRLLLQNKDLVFFVVVPPKALAIFRKELSTKLNVSFSEISSQNKENKNSRIYLVSSTRLKDVVPVVYKLQEKNYKLGLLLDEGHILQSDDNTFTKLLWSIRKCFAVFWLATATPCGNDIYGLYNLMTFVNPKVLGTKEDFTRNFLVTERKRVKRFNRLTQRYEFPYEEVVLGTKNMDVLQDTLSEYIILKQKKYNLEFVYHKCDLDITELNSYLEASAGRARDTSKKNWAVRLNDLQRVLDNVSDKYSQPNKLCSKEKLLVKVVSELIDSHALLVYVELVEVVDRLEMLFKKLKTLGYNIGNIYRITGSQSFDDRTYIEKNLKIGDIVILTSAGSESINLQKSDSLILYDSTFSIKTLIQLIGRITRVDTKFSKQYVHFIEASGTLDTYKRLCISLHGTTIEQLFGDIATLPMDLTLIDGKTQQALKNKLLWSFKERRLPTEEEVLNILK